MSSNDFEMLREWLAEFPQEEPHAALDGIEAEVERLRAENEAMRHEVGPVATQNRELLNKVERLRADTKDCEKYHREWEAEVERLQAEADRMEALANERWAEVERLRAALEDHWDHTDSRCLICGESLEACSARAALAKEEV